MSLLDADGWDAVKRREYMRRASERHARFKELCSMYLPEGSGGNRGREAPEATGPSMEQILIEREIEFQEWEAEYLTRSSVVRRVSRKGG